MKQLELCLLPVHEFGFKETLVDPLPIMNKEALVIVKIVFFPLLFIQLSSSLPAFLSISTLA